MTTKAERRVRIGDWLVPYDDAEKEVIVERTLSDILTAIPGRDQECMNTRCIKAQRNEHVFPHAVYLVSTIKSRVYIVDQMDDGGLPSHAIRYELTDRDRRLIDAHDKYGAGEPGHLRLRIPRDPKGSPKRRAYGGGFAEKGGSKAGGEGPYAPKGKRKKPKNRRPVTSHSLGAKARYVAAVGALPQDE